ncbi:GAF domain-containing protein [Anabaena cylindrica FACHB-243]|uniref:Circadian input-output histidine kinase CikA n=1 Tax=Anabaena cylindrica (strain ATCC 27899 / PCC 7122) TaxID=272123 RepID=K9ZJJ5_ANACC|nr:MULTISPECIES: ATP-binding protein [Anabaena]AFZ58692.1 GAF sensor signal transduction histidine kinase [Anabaena cylindrica PCC 7122]MBD2420036.1 GAF domain-containing protein [Anabaena cylindrica FACHB-243]MBY5282993.1 GAF domain-containing protein [Anabaena sp. CCAP 1446/1C]MBY5306508.1 GAF domain-containing protein [Anabaena sp. CCAP 1446/1C]MCM2407069.1 ATP-binding protein [Anabaena sp. CCAP 1446/1C]
MTITANTQLANLFSQNLESINRSTDGLLATLGSELVYTQDRTGRYLTFDWQHSEFLDLKTEKILDVLNKHKTFTPVDEVAYLERLQRILTNLVPERVQCWFKCSQDLLELELTITPIMPRLGQVATTVLVMGRLLQARVKTQVVNQESKQPSQPELILPSLKTSQVSQQHQKLLNKITRNIRRTLNLDVIWQQTVDSLGKVLKLERCVICPYQPNITKVQVIAEYHQPGLDPMLGSEIDISSEPTFAQVLATLEPMVIEFPVPNNSQKQKFLLVASCYQDQANALFALSLSNECHILTESELELSRELADQLGTAIAHATLYKELEEARQQAEEASRLKSEFLANVSHEIRTPLNGMIGLLKLILEGMADGPEEHEFVQDAHDLSIHLLSILNDILDFAKIEAGKMDIRCGPVRLHELFTDVENFVRPQAEMKNLSFQIQMPTTSDEIIVQGNYRRLLQVLLNLVGNALKFTNEGGVTISADLVLKKGKGKLQSQILPGMVKVRVADTGIGVSLDKQDKLFQLFSQVDGSRTRHYGGTGLGLTISQKLIEAMGGEVHFYSLGEGLGSTVTFTVPLYQQPVLCSPSECEIETQF